MNDFKNSGIPKCTQIGGNFKFDKWCAQKYFVQEF